MFSGCIKAMVLALLMLNLNGATLAQDGTIDELQNQKNSIQDINQEKIVEETSETPAVVTEENKQTEEGIVPVLELKGGIKQAEAPKEGYEETPLKAWLNGDYATGDWGGLRTKLQDNGINLETVYTIEPFMNLRDQVPVEYFGNLDVTLELDTKKMHMWPGGKFFVYFQQNHGRGLTTPHLQDLQTLSNIDPGKSFTHLSEYWYEQSLFNDKFRIKLGKQDANEDFCSLDYAADHINSSFGLIPTIPLPTFPDPGMGVATFIDPIELVSIGVGVYDGGAKGGTSGFDTTFDGKDGAVTLVELSLKPSFGSEKQYPGKYQAGFWHHSGDVDEISDNPRTFAGNAGYYLGAEQLVFKENKSDDQGLALFAQYGYAPSERTELSRYYGLGMTYKGLIPTRNEDTTGVGTAFARLSKRIKTMEDRAGETVLEFFHKFQITPWFAVQPDIQYIYNAGGNERDAVAFGVRSVISF